MPTPTTRTSTPPQSGRIAQQAAPGTVVLQSYDEGAFPKVAFTNQIAVNLTQKALAYYDANGNWQSVVGGADVETFTGEVAPTGVGQTGDRWFNSKSLMWYSWNPAYGTWMPGDTAYSAIAPTDPIIGQAWFNVHTRALTYFNGTSWVDSSDPTAPGVYTGAMPAAANAGSAWTDSDGIAWGCDVTYTGGTGAGKWSRWAYRVDSLAELILGNANSDAIMAGESASSPPTPAVTWSSVTLGMIWLDTEPGSNLGKIFVWDGTAWRQVYAPNTIELCLALLMAERAAPEFTNSDQLRATGPGTAWLPLSHVPIDGSLHVFWNGLSQPPTEWDLVGRMVEIPDPDSLIQPGDVLSAAYAWWPGVAVTSLALQVVGTSQIGGTITSVALPAGTQSGDLFVLAVAAPSVSPSSDSRVTWQTQAFGAGQLLAIGYLDGSGSPVTVAVNGGTFGYAITTLTVYRGARVDTASMVSNTSPNTSLTAATIGGAPLGALCVLFAWAGTVAGDISGDSTGAWISDIDVRQGKSATETCHWLNPTLEASSPPGAFTFTGTWGGFGVITLALVAP